MKLRLVVIDGRDDRRQLMTHVLGQGGDVLVVGQANGPVSAVDAVDRLQADAVFLEIQLPLAQGLDTISVLRDDFPALGIIVCSFHATSSTKRAALDRGADAYLAKPVSLRDLRAVFRWAPRRSESLQRRVRVVEMADGSTPDRDAENGNPDRPLAH